MRDVSTGVASCATLLRERARSDEFSGAVLIARNGTPVLERSYGYACKGHGVRNHVDTLFNIGSMTKMFTAVSIVQLAEQGRLRFDDAVGQFLSEYPHEVGGVRIVGHNGGAPGVGAQLDMYLECGYTVAILSNYDAGVSMKVVQPIRQLLAGA